MRISISIEDFEAISFAIDQIESALESSDNLEWSAALVKHRKSLHSVCEKFKKERAKANELNMARQYVRSRNHWMPQVKVDKIARDIIKKGKQI